MDGHQYGVSIQISINLGKKFLRISRIRKIVVTTILARVCIFTFFHFPDSGLYLLTGFDFYFDLFWIAWHWKPAILIKAALSSWFNSAERQCDIINLLPSNDSGPIALVDNTVMFSVNMALQESLEVRLTTTPTSDDGYIFKIGASNVTLVRVQSASETSLKVENIPGILDVGWRTLWLDYRCTSVILGSGNTVILKYNDTDNHQMIHFIKFNRSLNNQTILLCNRQGIWCCLIFLYLKKKAGTLLIHRAYSLTWPTAMQIYYIKRKCLHKKRVELPQDWFGTPTWRPFHCFGIPIKLPWRQFENAL